MSIKRGSWFWVVVVFVVAAVAGAYSTTRFLSADRHQTESVEKKGPVAEVGVFTVDLEPEGRNSSRILRVTVCIQASSSRALKQMERRDAEVKHAIISILRGHTGSSLSGPEGMTLLQQEIRDSLNAILGDQAVCDVYFPEFVMQ